MLRGIDVSNNNGHINWERVRGVDFVYAKATEGTSFVDKYYPDHHLRLRDLGIPVGAYHFAQPARGTAKAQAEFFLLHAKVRFGDLLPCLDIEVDGGLSDQQLVEWVAAFVNVIRKELACQPVIYCSPAFWRTQLGNTQRFSICPLWIAHWGVEKPLLPGGWDTWAIHQTSAHGHVTGIPGEVDLDRAQTLSGLKYRRKLPKPDNDDREVPAPDKPGVPESKKKTAKRKASAWVLRRRMRQKVVDAALLGVRKSLRIHYSQQFKKRMWGVDHEVRPPDVPLYEDCSSFATWVMWVAGAPDPNGRRYDGFGYTGTMIENGVEVDPRKALPADHAFYGSSSRHITHTAVVVEGGPDAMVVSHGHEGGPDGPLTLNYRGDLQQVRRYIK